ncbi:MULTISPECIES: NUDIX domain-containing protein [Salinibaculum]|uniref:NUDIX domain-containing protein n=1 Tax=Salinibaculum TaxID=2732368 RepID=UPI0030D48113
MDLDAFRTVVKGLITHDGRVLIGQKEDDESHPIGGEWHLLGGHVAFDEHVEVAMRREVREETGLEVTVETLVDAMTFPWGGEGVRDSLQLVYHCEASTDDAKARDDLQAVQWVAPDELAATLFEEEAKRVRNRPRQASFVAALGD